MGFNNDDYTYNAKGGVRLDMPHLANTYCALCLLLLCGDYSFSRVKKRELVMKLPKF